MLVICRRAPKTWGTPGVPPRPPRRASTRAALKGERDPSQRAVLEGRQKALKLTANALYGFTGAQVGAIPRLFSHGSRRGRLLRRACRLLCEDLQHLSTALLPIPRRAPVMQHWLTSSPFDRAPFSQASPLQCVPLADSCLALGAQACRGAVARITQLIRDGGLGPEGAGARVIYAQVGRWVAPLPAARPNACRVPPLCCSPCTSHWCFPGTPEPTGTLAPFFLVIHAPHARPAPREPTRRTASSYTSLRRRPRARSRSASAPPRP